MKRMLKILARPKLSSPRLVAAWPGVGNVAMIIAAYLGKKLSFKELAEIEPSYFFDPIGVLAKDNVVEAPQFPQSRFYYYKSRGGTGDVILFVGEDQPGTKSYELANCVLDVALKFQVKRVYTCAAAMTRIHHSEPPRVFGVATSQGLAEELKEYELMPAANLQIAGLNGLLLGVAKERGVEGICLLGEVPMYATRIQNPMAALAVTKVLARMLGIVVDTGELTQIAAEAGERLKRMAAQAMGEYIDYFTEPIWEREEEEEEGGDGDEEE